MKSENVKKFLSMFLIAGALSIFYSCSHKSVDGDNPPDPNPPVTPGKADVAVWLTTPDKFSLFKKVDKSLSFSSTSNQNITINVDSTQTFQSIDGFGFALTGGSATLLNGLGANQDNVLNELFGTAGNGIGISYIRISIGASDMSATSFTYDEVAGDVNLDHFSISPESKDLIPVLKKVLAINPNIKILATPWTAPTWMKVNTIGNGGFTGGSLNTIYYDAYARYFVKYLQAMKAEGIPIDAITPQNEPQAPYNDPAMLMRADEQANFIKTLGAKFQTAGLTTKIICNENNPDHYTYADTILKDPVAGPYVDGSAFHLYGGDISSMSILHAAHPTKNIYFTEMYTGYPGNFAGDLQWSVNNLIIGATINWSRNVLEWALATDPSQGPHTVGGCNSCLGGITVNGTAITRNVGYYIIAHASKFVRPGAVRIGSNYLANLPSVAFKNTDGSKVLIVLNNLTTSQNFNIKFNDKIASTTLVGGAVATYVW